MGRPHLRKLLLVTGTYKEEIGKNGVTSLSWFSCNIFVSTKRYRNGHFTVRNCLARKLLVVDLKKKATSNQGCRLAAFLLLLYSRCLVMLIELCACARRPEMCGGWQGSNMHSPQSLRGCSCLQRGLRGWLGLEAPGYLERTEAEGAAQLFPPLQSDVNILVLAS